MNALSEVYAGMCLSTETEYKCRQLLQPSSYKTHQDEYCRMIAKQEGIQIRKERYRCNVFRVEKMK